MTKIYDCFLFFNELDLLEIRLSELNDFVDYFVLVEARQNHQGKSKPLYFKENKERFKKWNDKIIHIIVDLPRFNFMDRLMVNLEKGRLREPIRKINGIGFFGMGFGGLKMDHWQRRLIIKGLKKCGDEDIIVVSDLDDIPRSEKMREVIELLTKHKVVTIETDFYNYYINGKVCALNGSQIKRAQVRACKFKTLKKEFFSNPHFLRSPFDSPLGRIGIIPRNSYLLKDAGWSFCSVGGAEKVKLKIESFCHSGEFKDKEYSNISEISKKIESGESLGSDLHVEYIRVDNTFPKTVLDNKKKFSHIIKE